MKVVSRFLICSRRSFRFKTRLGYKNGLDFSHRFALVKTRFMLRGVAREVSRHRARNNYRIVDLMMPGATHISFFEAGCNHRDLYGILHLLVEHSAKNDI